MYCNIISSVVTWVFATILKEIEMKLKIDITRSNFKHECMAHSIVLEYNTYLCKFKNHESVSTKELKEFYHELAFQLNVVEAYVQSLPIEDQE
jgi:hypothetical protein